MTKFEEEQKKCLHPNHYLGFYQRKRSHRTFLIVRNFNVIFIGCLWLLLVVLFVILYVRFFKCQNLYIQLLTDVYVCVCACLRICSYILYRIAIVVNFKAMLILKFLAHSIQIHIHVFTLKLRLFL